MDPLSISASVIALLSAANATFRGLEKLRGLRHAPNELLSLLNEVADLQAVLTLVRDTFQSLQDCGSQVSQHALQDFPRLINRAADAINDLNSFVHDDLMKGQDFSADGRPSISRRAWLGKDKKLEMLRRSVKEARENLLVVLLSVNLRIFPQALLNIQEVAIVGKDTLARSTATLEHVIEKLVAHPSVSENSGELTEVNNAARNVSISNAISTPNVPQKSSNEASHQLRITTSLNLNQCDRFCYCQCHVHIRGSTPRWLQSVIGTLFYSYSGTPTLNTQSCTSRRCRRSTSSSTSFSYYFPTWFIQRALLFTSTWKDITGAGASWSVRVPRIIPSNHRAWHVIEQGNLRKFQEIFALREVSPFDIREDGDSLLHDAQNHWQSDICAHLLRNGADWHLKNQSGMSPADAVWARILRFGDDRYVSSFKRLLGEDDDYNLQLSPLHRIVTGLAQASLTQQLELDSSNLDIRDWCDRTPLMWAAIRGNVDEVRALINNGSNFQLVDCDGNSVLHLAVGGSCDCVLALLEAGANVNVPNFYGRTPLHQAIISAPISEIRPIIEILSQHGADIEAKNIDGRTPLFHAVLENSSDAICILTQCGADLNAIDSQGNCPLPYAIRLNYSEALVTLCKEGAKLTWKLSELGDENVLETAAVFASVEVMEIIAEIPTEPILYDPDYVYDSFNNYRAQYYIGPEEDPAEELAAFEYLLQKIGRPITSPEASTLDETDSFSYSDQEEATDEEDNSGEDDGDDGGGGGDGKKDSEIFEDALEIQNTTGSVA